MKLSILAVPVLATALAACTQGWVGAPERQMQVLSGSPQGVVVGPVRSAAEARARAVAEAHCQRYGLNAEWPRMVDSDKVHFMCIE